MIQLALQTQIVYGPVTSRRFGTSLGVNLLPANKRECTFNCGYCQYDGLWDGKPPVYPAIDDIQQSLEAELKQIQASNLGLDWIMLSGNGEPTLHPEFHKAVETVLSERDRWMPNVSVGILSNSTTCYLPEIRRTLALLDGRFMKLDAGNLDTLNAVNRPRGSHLGLFSRVLHGLSEMRAQGLTIQSMFVAGSVTNTSDEDIEDWIEAVKFISPKSVQIYTVDREPQDPCILPVTSDALKAIARRLKNETGITVHVF